MLEILNMTYSHYSIVQEYIKILYLYLRKAMNYSYCKSYRQVYEKSKPVE